ncbi:phosphoglycerate kinase [Candidatus Falkowbacteria bacterium]|nr:phosphoglycerate kinase [Candidatus Falkowbacteria bacterium]
MQLKSLEQIKNLKNKRVLVRVDYNVDIEKSKVTEPERIDRTFRTINYLVKNHARVILMSHLGKPEGKRDEKYSLKPVATYLDKQAKKPVYFVNDCIGNTVKQKIEDLKAGQILLLENLRFYSGEEKNDAKFAHELASLADIYINDAFAVVHRAHASVSAITKYLPSYAGYNLIDEVDNLSKLLSGFEMPAVAIIGGVKISTKIKVLENFLKKYDKVLIGGALANNFFAAKKYNIGQSVYEPDFVKLSKQLLDKYKDKIVLPLDIVITNKVAKGGKKEIIKVANLNKQKNKKFFIVDIGIKTELYFESIIKSANTLVWNGAMGVFEIPQFSHGSDYLARIMAMQSRGDAFGAVGGGETIVIIKRDHLDTWFDFVSTGGGAMLEFLEGKILPGIKPLIK